MLRSVVRRAGLDAVRAHWPGTDDGFAAITRLTGLHRPHLISDLLLTGLAASAAVFGLARVWP